MFYPIAGNFVLCLTPTRHRSAAAKAEVVINVNKPRTAQEDNLSSTSIHFCASTIGVLDNLTCCHIVNKQLPLLTFTPSPFGPRVLIFPKYCKGTKSSRVQSILFPCQSITFLFTTLQKQFDNINKFNWYKRIRTCL